MITFLIPVKSRVITPEILGMFSSFNNAHVMLLLEKSNNVQILPEKNVTAEVVYFQDGTLEEDMIESVISKVYGNSMVLIRDGAGEINIQLIKKMLLKLFEGFDVVLPKRNVKQNFFQRTVGTLGKKIVKWVLNSAFYEGEIGIQVFNSKAISILKINGTRTFTKINRWFGVRVGYVEEVFEKPTFVSSERKLALLFATLFTSLFAVLLAGAITLGALTKIPWLGIMGFIFGLLVSFSVGGYYWLKLYSVHKVGDITGQKVAIIDSREVKYGE